MWDIRFSARVSHDRHLSGYGVETTQGKNTGRKHQEDQFMEYVIKEFAEWSTTV